MRFPWSELWKKREKLSISSNRAIISCQRSWVWERRSFVDFDLWIVLEGSGEMHLNNEVHTLSRGFGILFPPGPLRLKATHNPTQALKVFYCHFEISSAMEPNALSDLRLGPQQLGPNLFSAIDSFAAAENSRNRSALQESILWQLLLELEQHVLLPDASTSRKIDKLTSRIRENPGGIYTVREMAAESGLSEGHFRRLFKRATETTPTQFVVSSRIRLAKYYLLETKLPVEEIATLCGYSDIFFFSRQFKDRCDASPSHFRKFRGRPCLDDPRK